MVTVLEDLGRSSRSLSLCESLGLSLSRSLSLSLSLSFDLVLVLDRDSFSLDLESFSRFGVVIGGVVESESVGPYDEEDLLGTFSLRDLPVLGFSFRGLAKTAVPEITEPVSSLASSTQGALWLELDMIADAQSQGSREIVVKPDGFD